MDETRSGLGSFEAKILSDLMEEGKSVFSIKELVEKTGSPVKARKMASKLVKKKWLGRLARGVYLVLELSAGSKPQWTEDSYYIASKLVSPYYIGYYNALHDYGWTEQVPLAVSVATTKKLRSRAVLGVDYKFITVSKKKFFGTTKKLIRGREILVSNPEKTIVDALDHPEYCGGIQEVAKALYIASRKRSRVMDAFRTPAFSSQDYALQIDWPRVVEYAEKTGNGAILKRLGYLVELMEIRLPEEIKQYIKPKLTKGYAPLYPGVKAEGKHDSKWRVILNTRITKQLVLA